MNPEAFFSYMSPEENKLRCNMGSATAKLPPSLKISESSGDIRKSQKIFRNF